MTTTILAWRWLGALALAGALAAQEEGEPAPAPPTPAELRQTADAVSKQVEQLLGRSFKAEVAKSVMTRAELRTELAKMMQKEFGGGRLERTEAWLHALALLPADVRLQEIMTDVLLSQIGGFYDPERKAFFMMAESAAYGDAINRMMIAHELCHALDDQYVDLQRLQHPGGRAPTEDESYCIGGVVEGNATCLMFAWMAQAMQQGAKLADLAKVAEQQKDQMAVMQNAPPYCGLLAATYMVGQYFMNKGQGMAGLPAAVDGQRFVEVAANMPRSSEQLLHPDKYWREEDRDEPVVFDDDALVALLERRSGQSVVERNTLGELVAALVAGPPARKLNPVLMARADYWTNRAAIGWGGDRLFVLASAPVTAGRAVEGSGVVWATAWDTVADREEFVAAVRRHRGDRPGFDVEVDGRLAVFAFAGARSLGAEGLQAALRACQCVCDGKPWSR